MPWNPARGTEIAKDADVRPLSLGLFDRLVWLGRSVDPLLPWDPMSIIAIGVKN
jgi:hypothetical protein